MFCPSCGIRLSAPLTTLAPAVTAAQSAACPSCGAPDSPNAAFCGYCGQKMQPSGAPVPPVGLASAPAPISWSPQPRSTPRLAARRQVIALAAVLVLVAGGLGTAWMLRGGAGDSVSADIDRLPAGSLKGRSPSLQPASQVRRAAEDPSTLLSRGPGRLARCRPASLPVRSCPSS